MEQATSPHPQRRHKPLRVALYSPGMVGLGHMRRSLLIAQTLVRSQSNLSALFIGESREAGSLPIPEKVDCLTLPALQKDAQGNCEPRYLGISLPQLLDLRANAISAVLQAFDPSILIVDHLPRGACRELDKVLPSLKARGTQIVLGLRDILEDPIAVRREWTRLDNEQAIRDHYATVWVYGDRRVCDHAQEYGLASDIAAKINYVGYLDQSARLDALSPDHHMQLDKLRAQLGRFVLCTVGGGSDGVRLAEAFAQSELPAGLNGILLTGPYMPNSARTRVRERVAKNPRMQIVDFLPEPTYLLQHAEAVISMGGYNSACEALSFARPTLMVPRAAPKHEQLIRAQRLSALGLMDMLTMESITPTLISAWMAQIAPPQHTAHSILNMNGFDNLPIYLNRLTQLPHARPTNTTAAAIPAPAPSKVKVKVL